MDPQIQRLLSDPIFRYSEGLTIGYLMALRGYDKDSLPFRSISAVMAREHNDDYEKGLELGAEARKAGSVPPFLGFYPDEDLPLKRKQEVTILKGTMIRYRGESKPAGRTRKILIDHILNGSNFYIRKEHGREVVNTITPPKVRWPGSGGYWSEVDINDIPEAREVVLEDQRKAALAASEDHFQKLASTLKEICASVQTSLELMLKDTKEDFQFQYRAEEHFVQVNVVTPDHATLASLCVEPSYTDRRLTLRINITSSICQAMPGARLIFKALSLIMATAEHIDATYCQPWNEAQ